MKKLIFIFIGLLSFSLLSAQRDSLKLNTAYELSRENYDGFRKNEILNSILDNKTGIVNSSLMPQLMLNAEASYQSHNVELPFEIPGTEGIDLPNERYKAYASVQQVIYKGGETEIRKQINEVENKIEKQQIEVQYEQVKELMLETYYGLAYANEKLRLHKQARSYLDSKLNSLRSAFRDGVASEQDTLRLYTRILDLNAMIMQQKEEISSLIDQMELFVGIELSDSLHCVLPVINEVQSVDISPTQQHILLNLRRDLMHEKEKSYRVSRRPRVQAFAEGGIGSPDPLNILNSDLATYGLVGLRMQWNIWDWGASKKQQQITRLQSEIIQEDEAILDKNREIEIRNLQNKVEKLRIAVSSTAEKRDVLERVRNQSEVQLEKGTRSMESYLDDNHDLQQTELQLKLKEIQLAFAKAKLLDVKGVLFN